MEASAESFELIFHLAFVGVGLLAAYFLLRGLVKLLAAVRFRGVLVAMTLAGVLVIFLSTLLSRPRHDATSAEIPSPAAAASPRMQPETARELAPATRQAETPPPAAAPVPPPSAALSEPPRPAEVVAVPPVAEFEPPPPPPGPQAGDAPHPPPPMPADQPGTAPAETQPAVAPPRPAEVAAVPPATAGPEPPAPPPPQTALPGPAKDPAARKRQRTVLFASDRSLETADGAFHLGAARGSSLVLGRARVELPDAPEGPGDAVLGDTERLEAGPWSTLASETLRRPGAEGHAIVLVHGYRTTFGAALRGAGRLAAALEGETGVFLFSWPSGSRVASYSYESESARHSATRLRQLIELVVGSGAAKLSLVAEGLGAQTLLSALDQLRASPPSGAELSELILVAPDLDAAELVGRTKDIKAMARRVTLYATSADPALQVARRFHAGVPRAGDVPDGGPLVVDGIETVDMTGPGTGCFAESPGPGPEARGCAALAGDIARAIAGAVRPPDLANPGIERRTTSAGATYWRYP